MREKIISLTHKIMYLETLPSYTKNVFDTIISRKEMRPLTLIWWTALALQIGHRESIDLVFVSYDTLQEEEKRSIKKISSTYEVVYESNEQLDIFIYDAKITLLSYRWQPEFPLIPYKQIKLWNIRDIATSKAYTIGRRSEIKDYVDLYILLSSGKISFDRLIQHTEKRYQWDFSEKLFLKQLTLIDQCEMTHLKMHGIYQDITIKEVQKYFNESIKQRR